MKLKAHAFTLRQLQYAVALADTLNVGHAAALCHVQRPSFSQQLAQLEDALGVELFEHGKRNRVTVTEAGQDVLERARRLLVDADDLAQGARRVRDPLAGALRVGVGHTLASTMLPSVTPALRERFPRLTLLWIEDTSEVLLRSLGAGELDAALLEHEPDARDLELEVVADDPFHALTWPRRSPLAPALRQLAAALRETCADDAQPPE